MRVSEGYSWKDRPIKYYGNGYGQFCDLDATSFSPHPPQKINSIQQLHICSFIDKSQNGTNIDLIDGDNGESSSTSKNKIFIYIFTIVTGGIVVCTYLFDFI